MHYKVFIFALYSLYIKVPKYDDNIKEDHEKEKERE